jgi:hypothetical protein
MKNLMKRVALVTGANTGIGLEVARQEEMMEYSIQESVRRSGKAQISARLEVTIPAGREPVFDFVAAEDVLPKVLTGYGLLPAVVRTSGNTGPWDRPGSARTVHLADGTTAREQVTAYERPRYFAYRTSDYTFALRYLAKFAEGQWWFEDDANGTKVRWTYTFHAKGRLTSVPLWMFAKTQWVGYMRACIRNVQNHFAI